RGPFSAGSALPRRRTVRRRRARAGGIQEVTRHSVRSAAIQSTLRSERRNSKPENPRGRSVCGRREFLRQGWGGLCFVIPLFRDGKQGQPVLAPGPWFAD